jgi:hypothetical protein
MKSSTYRPLLLAVALAVAVLSAAGALAASNGSHMSAHMARHHHSGAVSAKELALRNGMRQLWEEHVTWTRLAIISLTTDLPDTNATVARLLQNQTDIGNAVKPFYGKAAGKQLTALLREHILIAADLIDAAKRGDSAAVAQEQAKWTDNANRIAAFLNRANPRAWKLGAMKAMMHDHLRLTTNEVLARLNHDWTGDVRAYDRIERQILKMADMLSMGLVGHFPGRFR